MRPKAVLRLPRVIAGPTLHTGTAVAQRNHPLLTVPAVNETTLTDT